MEKRLECCDIEMLVEVMFNINIAWMIIQEVLKSDCTYLQNMLDKTLLS